MDEEHSVHDVAALFKEFLRDMPESLLTKELYTAFINTMCKKKTYTINNPLSSDYFEINVNCFLLLLLFFSSTVLNFSEQDSAIQLLVFMLPPCNSDTLQRLLGLLSTVSAHAEDSLDSEGQKVEAGFYSSLKCF